MKKKFSLSIVLVGVLLALFASIDAHSQTIRIKFKEDQSDILKVATVLKSTDGIAKIGIQAVDQLNIECNATSMKRIFPYAGKYEKKHQKYGLHLWYEITVEEDIELSAIIKSYQSLNEISIAESLKEKKLYKRTNKQTKEIVKNALTTETNDPQYEDQWHYNNTGQTGGTVDADIDLPEAWAIETGSSDVIVSVHDGGIDYDHSDLDGNMWINSGEIASNGVDDDNNGYIDDVYGYNFVSSSGSIVAVDHGTHVGGTIAAETNNGTGMAGIAGGTGNNDGIRLMSSQVFTDASSGGIEESYVYAADNGAIISQNSWGYTVAGEYDQSVLDAIDYFIAEAGYDENGNQTGPMAGGIVIFAAGNDGTDDEWYPGYYEPVMAVAATDHNDEGAYYSNYGDWVELAAPGSSVQSTYPYDEYGTMTGTSMACPHVSGVAALIVSKYKDQGITPEQVWWRLVNSTDTLTFSGASGWGTGRLNAFSALLNSEQEVPDSVTDLLAIDVEAVTVTLTFTTPADKPDGYSVCEYDLRGSTSEITAGNFNEATRFNISTIELPGIKDTITVTGLTPGTSYYFALKSSDYYGNTSDISNIISFTTELAPEITVSGDLDVEIDVSVDSTQSASINIANSGPVDLNFDIVATYLGRTAPTSTLIYPGAGLNCSDVNIVPSSTSGTSSVKFVAESNNSEDVELDFEYEYTGTIIYDDYNNAADGTLGVTSDDEPIAWSSATAFQVPEDYDGNFTLTHISSYIEASESTEETTLVSILKGGETPTKGELLLSQEVENVDGEGFDTILLEMPLVFEPGDKFWVVYAYEAVSIRLGYDELSSGVREGAYYAYYSGAWNDVQSIDGYEEYVWTIRAIEASIEGISFSLTSGTISSGNSQDVTVLYDASGVEHNGDYNYKVFVKSNDPVTPVEAIECTAVVSGFPAPIISVSPDTINSAIDAYENPYKTEILTINNTGPAELTFNFAELEESAITYHIPAATSKIERDVEGISFEKAPSVSNSAIDYTSTTLLGSGSLAYGYEISPNTYFVSLNTEAPGTYLSTEEISSSNIFAADFVGIDNRYLYVNDYSTQELTKLNVETGESEVIGTTLSFIDFAGDRSSDILYAIYYDSDNDYSYLYTVNTETAEATQVGGMCSGCMISMACDGEGNLYGVNLLGSNFLSIDPSKGTATHIGYLDFTPNYAQSMAWDPEKDIMYLAAYNYGESQGELRIADKTTGGTEFIGTFPDGAEISAFAIPGEGYPEFISSISPNSGTVAPNSSLEVSVNLDATLAPNGDYSSAVTIYSNDYDNSVVNVPVNLTVSGQVGEVAAKNEFLDFGTVFQYGKKEMDFKLYNNGIGDLLITGIVSDLGEFTTDFSDTVLLDYKDSVTYTVTFNSSSIGNFNGILTILSDDPDNDSLEISVVATAIAPPVIELSNDSVELTLNNGKDTTLVLAINNTGTYPLQFSMPDTAITLADSVNGDPFDVIVSPTEGIIQPGMSKDINLYIDAKELFDGTYENELIISNSDPLNPNKVFKTKLHVIGIPAINVETTELAFSSIASGTEESKQVAIKNNGTKELTISSINFSDAAFFVDAVAPFVIAPQSDSLITVTFSPSVNKDFSGDMVISSDDAYGKETISIPCSGTGLIPPALTYSYSPNPADFVLNQGETDSMSVLLTNSGEADLEFFIIKPYYTILDSIAVSSEEESLQDHNGSDDFGYSWIDNDVSDEFEYKWIEISLKGKNLGLGDDNSAVVDLPFTFPFYEGTFNQVTVAANGFLTFGSDLGWGGGYDNKDIPSGYTPNYLIAPLWRDLQPNNGGGIYAYSTPEYVVVQYNEIPGFYCDGTATFEVILYPTGDIKFQYKDVDDFGGVGDCTIGTENIYGSKGLRIAYESDYAKNQLAIMINSPFLSGVVPSGMSAAIDLLIETDQLIEGKYEMSALINTNDPDNESVEIETSLQVYGTPEISVANTLAFDNVYYYRKEVFKTSKNVVIYNTGSKNLVINSMQILPDASVVTGSFNYPVTIPPGELYKQELTFYPIESGEYNCTLQIESNDTSVKDYTLVNLIGTAIDVPVMEISSLDTLKLNLQSDEVVTNASSIINDGDSVLNYSIKPYYSIASEENTSNSGSSYIVDLVDSITYDPDRATDGYLGYGSSSTFNIANRFTVTSDNFMLSHISNCYRNEGATDSLRLQVWKGGDVPGQGTLALTQNFYHSEAVETGYYMVELKDTINFQKGDEFFVAVRYPISMDEPATYNGSVTGVSGVSYYLSLYSNSWVSSSTGVVYKIRAFEGDENSYVDDWISANPASGALRKDESFEPQIYIDAAKAGAGVHTATVKFIPDDRFNSVQELPIEISVNSAPAITVKPADTLYVEEMDSIKFTLYGYDPDKGDITYTLNEDLDFVELSILEDSAVVSIAPTYSNNGVYSIGVNVTDDEGESVLAEHTVIVEDVNLVPQIITAIDKKVYYSLLSVDEINLDNHFVDYDGDTLLYSAYNSNNQVCAAVVDSNMLLISASDTGLSVVSVKAIDNYGEFKTLTFNVEVKENQSPILESEITSVFLQLSGSDTSLNLTHYFSDPDGHELYYSADVDSGQAVSIGVENNILTLHPLEAGQAKIAVKANDDYSGSVSANFKAIVKSSSSGLEGLEMSDVGFSCFPNPAEDKTTIAFLVEEKGIAKIEFYNSKGVKIDVLVDEYKTAGEYNIEHVLSEYPAGMYFYRFSVNNIMINQNSLIIK